MERTNLFREIHKNTWLKKVGKKSEKFWVVFCVHDDFEAILEGYAEPKFASSHSPDWTVSLKTCMHVSHTLFPSEQDYEFVITLSNDVIRFSAISWEIMQEWVDTLRSKLREMKILSPKENLYTRLPEVKQPLLPTRDPTSPLPAVPPVPAAIVPGIERIPQPTSNSISHPTEIAPTQTTVPINETSPISNGLTNSTTIDEAPTLVDETVTITSDEPVLNGNPNPLSMSNTLSQNLMNLLSNPIAALTTRLSDESPGPSSSRHHITPISSSNSTSPVASPVTSFKSLAGAFKSGSKPSNGIVIPRPKTKKAALKNFSKINSVKVAETPSNDLETSSSNITIIQVSDSLPVEASTSFKSNISVNTSSTNQSEVTTVQVIPSSESVSTSVISNDYGKVSNSGITNIAVGAISNVTIQPSPSTVPTVHYEPVFIANIDNSTPFANDQQGIRPSPQIVLRDGLNCDKENSNVSNPSTSLASASGGSTSCITGVAPKAKRKEPPLQRDLIRGITELSITRPSRSKMVLNSQTNAANNIATATADSNADSPQRKRSLSSSDQRTGPANPRPFINPRRVGSPENAQISGRLSLREQQVFQLRREMAHPGGVRLQLRRKDCIGSIAWVDAFRSVFIAGWKQNDHPMLYNALHIGDQLVSVRGVSVTTSNEANKLMRSTHGPFVELIIRRVPFGRVYAIRRELDGQCLGLIRDNNTATIVDIVPNSLAARHGLPAKAKTCDGLSLTFWMLTEINGRPLNLFFKDNEIQDRLNAVGRDISILVQPQDLVLKLKKQLKSIRSHKDFIVQ